MGRGSTAAHAFLCFGLAPWAFDYLPVRSLPPFMLLNTMRVVVEQTEIKCLVDKTMCAKECVNLTGQHIRSSFGTSGIGEDW